MRNEVIEIIGRDNCPFCVMAVQLCEDNFFNYTYRKIGEDLTRDEVREMYPIMTTVPIILVDNVLIGGYQQLKDYLETENAKG